MRRLRIYLTRFGYLSLTALMLSTCTRTLVVFADCNGFPDTTPPSCISQKDLEAITQYPGQDPYYDPDAVCNTADALTASADPSAGGSGGSGVWKSGLQPPYIIEQFAIQLLENIAAKRQVPTANTVTLAHVEALVTFAYGEGGGSTNNDFWNPYNAGYGDPALLATAHAVDGKQAYKNFDDGVEAIARAMSGWSQPPVESHFQTRLGDILTKPDSSVAQFFHALTYYKETPGNLEWATASLSDPGAYYDHYISLSSQIIDNWSKTAAMVMRGSVGDSKTLSDSSKLTFHPGATIPTNPDLAGGTASADSSAPAACCDTQGPSITGATGSGSMTADGVNNMIVLDPGHSGDTIGDYDPTTGLVDFDYRNTPEIDDMYEVAGLVQTQLKKDGYTVDLTKSSAHEDVSFRQRATKANDSHAALAVSIHDQAGPPGTGISFSGGNNYVYPQQVGGYRQNYGTLTKTGIGATYKTSSSSTGPKVSFTDANVASTSQKFAEAIRTQRTAAEGHLVTVKADAGGDIGTRLPARGDMWMVQLFSKVPWIYNEAGGYSSPGSSPIKHKDGLSDADKQKYANGLIKGIEAAVPLKGGTPVAGTPAGTASACDSPVNGVTGNAAKIVAEAKLLAWPNGGHGKYRVDAFGNYGKVEVAVDGYTSDTSGDPAFSDCGVFVATTVKASGVDPKYVSRGTDSQRPYLESHPSIYTRVLSGGQDPTSTASLQPGDILVTSSGTGHTYIYMGPWGNGNKYNSAGASWFGHVPQATRFYQSPAGQGQHFEVFRVKG